MQNNKNWAAQSILALLVVGLIYWFASGDDTPMYSDKQYSEVIKNSLIPPYVVDAAWQDKNLPSLVISIKPNSQKRVNSLPLFFCGIMRAQGIMGGFVHIIDSGQPGWNELAKTQCHK